MKVLLCRSRVSLLSGTGPLIVMQAEALRRQGCAVLVGCERGAWKVFFRTGLPARRFTPEAAAEHAGRAGWLVVDHGMRLPRADVLFVHNLATLARLHVAREELDAEAAEEAEQFRRLDAATPVVANSHLVRQALVERCGLAPQRVVVHYPGYRAARFNPERTAALRAGARRELALHDDALLVGFVTSGDLQLRGLDLFLTAAERIGRSLPQARFLVVGSARLPRWAADHALVRSGRVLYRPRSASPERWFAALDVFFYPARFDAFGLVVIEALACGVPVITSRRVGAAECLPAAYAPWIAAQPEGEELAELAIALCSDATAREELVRAGLEASPALAAERYVAQSLATILGQKR
ncbi:MAG TPA: glycosyltransferase family 4 protein [Gammaproteobacteria bacterium]